MRASFLPSLLFLLSALTALPASAQTPAAVRGVIVSAEGQQPLPGATVVLRRAADSTLVTGAAADTLGRFAIRTLAPGAYLLEASFVGYRILRQPLAYAGQPVDVGTLRLADDPTQLDDAIVEGQAILVQQRADTLVFDARQFKVNRDATAEDLVKKMPGVTVQDGQVQVQGEAVQRVTLDGREMFGGDATSSLRNLPAEMVSQVETFEGISENSRFSGFDDGDRVRTINLVSRAGFQNTAFGRVYGGYGNEETYQAGTNVNVIRGQQRVNVVAQSNNVGQQNFAFEDLLGLSGMGGGRMMRFGGGGRGGAPMMVRSGGGGFGGFGGDFAVAEQNGITTTHAVGLNYSDRWARNVEFSGSYFFNYSDNSLRQDLGQQYVAEELAGQRYDEFTNGTTLNQNHRASGRLNVSLGPATALQVRPRLTTQRYRNDALEFSTTRSLSDTLAFATTDETARQGALSFSNEVLFRHRFDASDRTVSLGVTTTYNNRNRETTQLTTNRTFEPQPFTRLISQTGDSGSDGWGYTATGTVSQSWGQAHAALLSFAYGWQETDSDQEYFDVLTGTPVIDSTLSTRLQSGLTTYRAGTGYRYRSDKVNLTALLDYEIARQARDQQFPDVSSRSETFHSVLPSINLRYNWSRQRNVSLNVRARTDTPSIEQLDDALDNTNALRLTQGNPALDVATNLSGSLRFLSSDFQAGRVFVIGLNGDYSLDYIGSSIVLATQPVEVAPGVVLAPGGQFTRPVNLDGRYGLRLFATFGRPIKPIKSNASVNVFTNYTRTPSLLNGQTQTTENLYVGPGLQLTSNISEKVDFSVGTNSALTFARSTSGTADQQYLTQNTRASLNLELPQGFTFRTDALHQTYAGLDENSQQEPFLLWNASVGKRVLAGGAGEIRLTATDLLNQNENYRRSVTDLYVQDVRANTLQRYLQLVFTYTLRPAGAGAPATPRGRMGG